MEVHLSAIDRLGNRVLDTIAHRFRNRFALTYAVVWSGCNFAPIAEILVGNGSAEERIRSATQYWSIHTAGSFLLPLAMTALILIVMPYVNLFVDFLRLYPEELRSNALLSSREKFASRREKLAKTESRIHEERLAKIARETAEQSIKHSVHTQVGEALAGLSSKVARYEDEIRIKLNKPDSEFVNTFVLAKKELVDSANEQRIRSEWNTLLVVAMATPSDKTAEHEQLITKAYGLLSDNNRLGIPDRWAFEVLLNTLAGQSRTNWSKFLGEKNLSDEQHSN